MRDDYRHEIKFEITRGDMITIRQRLGAIAKRDSHAKDGIYLIRSLYFDTPGDTALREKIAEYAKYSLAHRGRVMTEEELEVARGLMTENIRRCEELKFQHLLKGENDGREHDH